MIRQASKFTSSKEERQEHSKFLADQKKLDIPASKERKSKEYIKPCILR